MKTYFFTENPHHRAWYGNYDHVLNCYSAVHVKFLMMSRFSASSHIPRIGNASGGLLNNEWIWKLLISDGNQNVCRQNTVLECLISTFPSFLSFNNQIVDKNRVPFKNKWPYCLKNYILVRSWKAYTLNILQYSRTAVLLKFHISLDGTK